MIKKVLNKIRIRRAKRVRAKIVGTKERPRLSVFRSNRCLYVQLIDDARGETLISASTRGKKGTQANNVGAMLGKLLAEKAKEAGIKTVVLDRGKYAYHGKVKALAEALRENGIKI